LRHHDGTTERPPKHHQDATETPPKHQDTSEALPRDTTKKQPKHHQDTSETPRRHDQDTSETPRRHHWDRDTAQAGSRGPNGTRLPLNLELATPSYRYWEKWVETFFFITKTTVFEPQRQMEKKWFVGWCHYFLMVQNDL
jgi:hypothetical protein